MKQIKRLGIRVLAILFLFSITSISFIAFPMNGAAATKENLKLDKKVTICVGRRIRLKVTGTTKKVTWSTSNKKIVKISKKGTIRGIKKGTATITARVGKKKLTCKVKVKSAVGKITEGLSVENAGWKSIEHYANEIYCKSSNKKVATVSVIPSDDGTETPYGKGVDVVVFGHKSGTATITITNDCNKEKVKFKVTVKKPETETAYQKMVDYILLNGAVTDIGDKVVSREYGCNNATAGILYDSMSKEVNYEYAETNDSAKVEWLMMPTEKENTEFYMVMWIYPSDSTEKYYVTTTIDPLTYTGENIVFEEGWYGTPAMESLQKIANEVSRNAINCIDKILKTEAGLTWKDVVVTRIVD